MAAPSTFSNSAKALFNTVWHTLRRHGDRVPERTFPKEYFHLCGRSLADDMVSAGFGAPRPLVQGVVKSLPTLCVLLPPKGAHTTGLVVMRRSSKRRTPCKYHKTGACKFGFGCNHSHITHAGAVKPPSRTQVLHLAPGGGALAAHAGAGAGAGAGAIGVARRSTVVSEKVRHVVQNEVVKPPPRHFDVTAVVDTSGSMAGRGLRAAKAALKQLTGSVLKGTDRLAVLGFNDTVTTAQPMKAMSKINLDAVLATLRAEKRTALWDAVVAGVKTAADNRADTAAGITKRRRNHRLAELVVLTDGEDTSSTETFATMAAALAKPGVPNFHFTLIAVGVPPTLLKTFVALCASRSNFHLIDVADHSLIDQAFGRVRQRMLQRTLTTITTVQVKTVNVHSTKVFSGKHAKIKSVRPH